jgi:hypothetical protein
VDIREQVQRLWQVLRKWVGILQVGLAEAFESLLKLGQIPGRHTRLRRSQELRKWQIISSTLCYRSRDCSYAWQCFWFYNFILGREIQSRLLLREISLTSLWSNRATLRAHVFVRSYIWCYRYYFPYYGSFSSFLRVKGALLRTAVGFDPSYRQWFWDCLYLDLCLPPLFLVFVRTVTASQAGAHLTLTLSAVRDDDSDSQRGCSVLKRASASKRIRVAE